MKIGRSRHLKSRSCCPTCDKRLDGATAIVVDGKKDLGPAPGDITVCAYCQTILLFDDRLRMRLPTFAEMIDLADDPRIVAIKPMLKKVFPP
jgi:hypothetical protein